MTTRNRYRFSTQPGSHQYFDEPSAATLDGAILEAKKLSKSTKSLTYRVYVSDTAEIPHTVRGFVEGSRWVWMKKCRVCRGDGVIARPKFNEPCEKCNGTGSVPYV
jgi:hypothetical protein